MLSIILPAYNEEEHIRKNTLQLIKKMRRIGNYEIIIVEESNDRTPELVEELKRKYKQIRHLHSSMRLGKGRAVECGIKMARGEKIIFMDVDLAVDLSAIDAMLDALEKYDVVVGSRYHPDSKANRTFLRLFLGRSYALLSSLLLGINVRDFQCGFKGFRSAAGKEIIKYTQTAGVFWDTEFICYSDILGYRIYQIPVVWKEMKGRNTKISIKTIFTMGLGLAKLCIRSRLR